MAKYLDKEEYGQFGIIKIYNFNVCHVYWYGARNDHN